MLRAQRMSASKTFCAAKLKKLPDFLRLEIPNASHRKILAALTAPDGYRETARDALHNRERDRAEIYAETRKKLLALIDNTLGDMGAQGWSRASLYER